MSVILDNFMKFAGPGSLGLHDVDVRAVIEYIMTLMRFEADERHIRLEQSVEESLPPVFGDDDTGQPGADQCHRELVSCHAERRTLPHHGRSWPTRWQPVRQHFGERYRQRHQERRSVADCSNPFTARSRRGPVWGSRSPIASCRIMAGPFRRRANQDKGPPSRCNFQPRRDNPGVR